MSSTARQVITMTVFGNTDQAAARQVITMTVFGNTDQAAARQVITMTLEPTGNPGKRHVWDGTQWVRIPEYTWNGTSWVQVL